MSLNNYVQVPTNIFQPKEDVTDFFIDPEYLTDVPVTYKWGVGNSTLGHVDHPSFDALRRMLGETGRIKVQTQWWNGDRVLREFSLNDHKFSVGDQFSCAAAIKWTLRK